MKTLAFTCCALLLPCVIRAQDAEMEHRKLIIGEINYFGYGDLPLQVVRAAVPWHVGDTLTLATFSRKPVQEAISSAIGKQPTDVNIVCCDSANHLGAC